MGILRSWTIVLAAGAVLAGSTAASAQARLPLELGTQTGFTFLHTDGVTNTLFGFPGGGTQGMPAIYLAAFLSPRIALEPQMSFTHSTVHTHVGDFDVTRSENVFGGVVRLAGYLQDPRSSPYLFADLGILAATNANSQVAPGFGIGYRGVVSRYLVLRPEARYRKWTDNGPDEFGIVLGFGVLLP